MDHYYALIMAGGGGTRLWPLSRKNRPKQMLPLVEERTMFQIAVERLQPLLPLEHIFVVTGRSHVEQLAQSFPGLPKENYIIEPFGQNTGPAVGLAIMHIRQRDPEAVIAVVTADQHIGDKEKFRAVLAAAAQVAAKDYIVTLGISPSFPSTGFGYIERGDLIEQVGGFRVFRSQGFTEKPDTQTAIHFLAAGTHSWNSGMFIFRIDRVLHEFERQQPEMATLLREIGQAIGGPDYEATLERIWPDMPKKSIDYAVMEGAENVAVIPVDIGWSDVGSWATLFEVLTGDLNGNVSRGATEGHIQIDTKETMVISDRMVVTIGIEDIVIVDTEDVLLVCSRDRSQDVRQVVSLLRAAGDESHL